MPSTPATETVTLAHFKPLAGADNGQSFPVHFNPSSLKYSISNTPDPQGQNGVGVQYVSQSTATLSMDLVFDTTMTGEDVRVSTDRVAKLLRPYQEGDHQVPPRVEFSWGAYAFSGIVSQYRESLDFFSAGGVPLRSAITLTLSSTGVDFDSAKNPNASVDGQNGSEPVVLSGGVGVSAVASALGDPRAARAIASLNGSASLRFGGSASLAVGGSVNLSAPAAFAVGGGIGLSAGVGIGGSAGIGANAGAGMGSTGGIAATAGGAFAGLRVGAGAGMGGGVANARALLPGANLTSGGQAGFNLGGAARTRAGGSLSADVGATADLGARIGFQD